MCFLYVYPQRVVSSGWKELWGFFIDASIVEEGILLFVFSGDFLFSPLFGEMIQFD